MMLSLLDPAQVGLAWRAVFEMQPKCRLVKREAAVEVGHAEHDMARAHDIERRIEHMLGQRHPTASSG